MYFFNKMEFVGDSADDTRIVSMHVSLPNWPPIKIYGENLIPYKSQVITGGGSISAMPRPSLRVLLWNLHHVFEPCVQRYFPPSLFDSLFLHSFDRFCVCFRFLNRQIPREKEKEKKGRRQALSITTWYIYTPSTFQVEIRQIDRGMSNWS